MIYIEEEKAANSEGMTYYYLKKDESGSLRSVEIDKLINCPFCGSNDLETRRIGESAAIAVNCNDCGCQGPTGCFPTQVETLWNSQTGETLKYDTERS